MRRRIHNTTLTLHSLSPVKPCERQCSLDVVRISLADQPSLQSCPRSSSDSFKGCSPPQAAPDSPGLGTSGQPLLEHRGSMPIEPDDSCLTLEGSSLPEGKHDAASGAAAAAKASTWLGSAGGRRQAASPTAAGRRWPAATATASARHSTVPPSLQGCHATPFSASSSADVSRQPSASPEDAQARGCRAMFRPSDRTAAEPPSHHPALSHPASASSATGHAAGRASLQRRRQAGRPHVQHAPHACQLAAGVGLDLLCNSSASMKCPLPSCCAGDL